MQYDIQNILKLTNKSVFSKRPPVCICVYISDSFLASHAHVLSPKNVCVGGIVVVGFNNDKSMMN